MIQRDIPYGSYCYTIKEINHDNNLIFNIKTNLCPYFCHLDNGEVMCSLIGEESIDDFLLSDQVKICGKNELDDEIDPFKNLTRIK